MNMMDALLKQATSLLGSAEDSHFDAAAQAVPREALGQSLASMFRSDHTESFGSMVGKLFAQSNANQQAGMLNQLLAATGANQVTPEQASHLSVTEVEQIAADAERIHPGVIDQVGHFYAEHATLIKTLGGAALAIALAKLREHQQG
ncbi:hypothetical protein [Dyella telluris]|uniref:Uncharacterized protein n=1 Tax=Dyella telluris TaxID=2763498 RepID=A0A7G8Q7W3_9GAMM|nr:hypothetical protein [Dyella telluris]QNK02871.1 hypothetical protein H8F01_07060 [Dyella telluris]